MANEFSVYKNKSVRYKGETMVIDEVVVSGKNSVTVFAGKNRMTVSTVELKRDFQIVETGAKGKGAAGGIARYQIPEEDKVTMNSITQTLLENIKSIKEDAKFIPQAEAMNNQVKSIIQLQVVKVKMVQAFKA